MTGSLSIHQIIEGEIVPTFEQVQALWRSNPYWLFPAVAALKRNPDLTEAQRTALQQRVAASIGNDQALRRSIGDVGAIFDAFYPDQRKPELSTSDTISTFLDQYSKEGSLPADDDAELQRLLSAPPGDYAASLEALPPHDDPNPSDDPTAAMLQAFLGPKPAPAKPQTATKPQQPTAQESEAQTPSLSEGFARILIKNGNYAKALEIITALNLNNPQKSAYFADQIRFLRKLIINDNKSTN